jgi:hypothetical protein
MTPRTPPHSEEHRHSAKVKGDRVTHRPRTLKTLLRWAQADPDGRI